MSVGRRPVDSPNHRTGTRCAESVAPTAPRADYGIGTLLTSALLEMSSTAAKLKTTGKPGLVAVASPNAPPCVASMLNSRMNMPVGTERVGKVPAVWGAISCSAARWQTGIGTI
jgi:hypothetical protein